MWLITESGFFSVVQKPDDLDSDTLTIRARVRADLDNLRNTYLPSMGPVLDNAGTDYPYRAKAPRAQVAKVMATLVQNIRYSNFKTAVEKAQGKARAAIYHDVWSALNRLPDSKARAGRRHSEPAIPKASAYGGVLIDEEGRVLLREPKNHFGGYHWTFGKGRPDPGETAEHAALREVREETGYDGKIIATLPKAYAGSQTTTAFFLMKPIGKQGRFNPDETVQTRWVSFAEARKLVAMNKSPGDRRDLQVLDDAEKLIKSMP